MTNICSYSILFIFIVLSGCNSDLPVQELRASDTLAVPSKFRTLDNLTVYHTDTEPRREIRFVKKAVFNDSVGIGVLEEFAIDNRDRVYIAEGGFGNNRQTVHVYKPDGSYLTTIGRAGAGPGEFRSISDINIHKDRLYIYDRELLRVSVFSLDPISFRKIIQLNSHNWENVEVSRPMRFIVRNDSTFLLGFQDFDNPEESGKKYRRYYEMDGQGMINTDLLFKERYVGYYQGAGISGPQLLRSLTLPFTRHSLMALSVEGKIYSAWSEDFLVKIFDKKGVYQRSFHYPYGKSKIDRNGVLSFFKNRSTRFRQALRSTTFPEYWPALNSLLIDDKNRLWVSTFTDSENEIRWWVLDETGQLIAEFDWPGMRLNRTGKYNQIRAIKNGFLYEVQMDSISNLQKIVKYQIMLN